MNTLLLVSVPFAVVTVIGPLVAPSGTVARDASNFMNSPQVPQTCLFAP
jgi:hypothetical protein